MKTKRRIVASLVSFVLAFSMLSTTALTAFADELAAGVVQINNVKAVASTQAASTKWATCGTCEWRIQSGVLTIKPTNGISGVLENWEEKESAPWSPSRAGSVAQSVKRVKVEAGVSAVTGFAMFCGMANVKSFDLSGLDTSKVTNMIGMFQDCDSVTSLNLSRFNTSKVIYFDWMFSGCSSLTSLNLSSFNTSNAEDMTSMFSDCLELTSLNLASFNTSNVEMMTSMFSDCLELTSLNLSNFDTSKVFEMSYMFSNCQSLASLNLSNFNTTNVRYKSKIFSNCIGLRKVSLSSKTNLSRMLPTPNAMYIRGATGKWQNSQGKLFTTKNIPVFVADTYIAQVFPVRDISKARISGLVTKAYTGKAVKQALSVKLNGITLKAGRDFTVSYKNNKKVGKATVTITGKGYFKGKKSVSFKIVKYKQPMKVAVATRSATVQESSLWKKATVFSNFVTVKRAKGKVTYTNVSTMKLPKVFKVNSKSGKVTIPRGVGKGTYTLKIKVAAAGKGQYAYGAKIVSVKIKVK